MPMETDTLEFLANAEGDWFFHCHILYHMMAGMNRVFEVGDYKNPLLPNREKSYRMLQQESDMPHLMANSDFATNSIDGLAMLQNTRWSLSTEWRLGYSNFRGYETEMHIGRYIGKMQWLMPFVGFDWRYRDQQEERNFQESNIFGLNNSKDNRALFTAGFEFTLPMLVIFQTEVFQNGDFRLQLRREDIPFTKRLRAGFMLNTDKEYMVDLVYRLQKNIGIRTHYDSDMGFGIGLWLNY
jgi:hypothetical protein